MKRFWVVSKEQIEQAGAEYGEMFSEADVSAVSAARVALRCYEQEQGERFPTHAKNVAIFTNAFCASYTRVLSFTTN